MRLQAEVQQLRAALVSPYGSDNTRQQDPRHRLEWEEIAYLWRCDGNNAKAILYSYMSDAVGFIQEARTKLHSFIRERREDQLVSIDSALGFAERIISCEEEYADGSDGD